MGNLGLFVIVIFRYIEKNDYIFAVCKDVECIWDEMRARMSSMGADH